jgi:hypothetical protein
MLKWNDEGNSLNWSCSSLKQSIIHQKMAAMLQVKSNEQAQPFHRGRRPAT